MTRPARQRENRRILAIHPGALGDVVMFGQFLSALRCRTRASVALVAGHGKARLLAGLGIADRALPLDSLPMDDVFSRRPVRSCRLPALLSDSRGCDLLVSCFAAGDSVAEERLADLCGAKRSLFLPVRPPADHRGHLVHHWALLAGLGDVPAPRWCVPPAWRALAREALRDEVRWHSGPDWPTDPPPEGQYLLVHPGAGSRKKCWPLERFVEVARRGEDRFAQAVFVLGPTELDWWGQPVIGALRGEFATVVNPPLEVLAGLAAGAGAFLGNDSGPSHLAAAVGTPTLALFGPSSAAHFAPRGPRVTVLARSDLADLPHQAVAAALEKG